MKTDTHARIHSRVLLCDGREFSSVENAALHCLQLLDLLSFEDGTPANGPRFREGTVRKLLKDVNRSTP